MAIKLDGGGSTSQKAYENGEAFKVLSSMIVKKDRLTISFFADNEGYSSIGVESSKTAWFKYRIDNNSFNAVIGYLRGKEIDLSKINPNQTEIYQTDADGLEDDFSTYVFKQLIEAGYIPQLVPLFRSVYGYINAVIPMFRGKIIFRLNRTEDLTDYLSDKGLI
ncbi:hypothetical protein [Bacteroides sp. 51]|uniref:hypothetical protein n=1 Tax=Bacteroides sp. 51 TaxID=2302938 RepID=UPI0013D86A16|nr:hypothetical protein [Bacteroides sp. 51]NDV84586.1 hypothetical protein [Bacteroides sp. 51]